MSPSSILVYTAPETLLALRATLLTRADLDTVIALRDAGYAGGDAIYMAFAKYIRDQGTLDPQQLPIEQFFQYAGEFLTNSGWGQTTLSAQDDTFCVIEIDQCWEADPAHQPDPRGCHLTMGLLGAFLGKFADYPVALLEVEGPGTESDRCRFIAGNMEMIEEYYLAAAAGSR
jgi:predicted hydrocarbon binding protein